MPTVSPIPTAASRTAGATWRPTAGNGGTARALTVSADLGTVVHKPGRELDDPKELLLGFLDYYRSVIIRKVDSLTDAQLRESRLPSGWTPLELLKHLSYMERRWLRCGFRAEQLPDPHGDEDQAGRWHAGPGDTAASLIAALLAAGEQTRAIACAAELTDISAPGGRFSDNDPRPPGGTGVEPHLRAAGVCPPRRAPGRRTGTGRRHNRTGRRHNRRITRRRRPDVN
jgi:hypothetical protein